MDKFRVALEEKIRQYASQNSMDKQTGAQNAHAIMGVRRGNTLHFSAYLSKQEFQKIIDELNQHFDL